MASMLSSLDWDHIFAYTVPRTVTIRDRTLGILHSVCLAVIVAYIVGYTIVYEQRYRLIATDAFGAARLQTRSSQHILLQWTSPRVGIQLLPCRFLNMNAMVYPEEEASAMLIATRITETNYTRRPGCETFSNSDCDYTANGSTTYYVGGPVDLSTLKIDHTMTSEALGLSTASLRMDGRILRGSTVIDPRDDYTGPIPAPSVISFGSPGVADIVPLRTLLRAAGVGSLDDGDFSSPLVESYRYAGMVLLVSLTYSNSFAETGSWYEHYLTYTMRVTRVPSSQFKVVQVYPAPGIDTADGRQTTIDRHGIRIIVKQISNIGTFDAATLLISLTSSLGLLVIAKRIVSFVARHLLPLRYVYRQYMSAQTVDFTVVRKAFNTAALSRFAREDLINPLPRVFEEAGVPPSWVPRSITKNWRRRRQSVSILVARGSSALTAARSGGPILASQAPESAEPMNWESR